MKIIKTAGAGGLEDETANGGQDSGWKGQEENI